MTACPQRVALVTGAGRGIGRGIALRLAQDGFQVVVNALTADPSNTKQGAFEVKYAIEAAGGVAAVFRADIADRDERNALVEFVAERFGRLDLLVNNAGVSVKERVDLLDAGEDSFDRVMNINLKGPYFLTQALAKRMVAWKQAGVQDAARIAFVTSISGYASSTTRGEYCISKAGLRMATWLFADRLGEFDIPVIAISPGIIHTDMTSGVQQKYDKLIFEQGLLPTRRWGEPEDVAKVIAAFARGDLDYSTGEEIEVGGGFRVRRL